MWSQRTSAALLVLLLCAASASAQTAIPGGAWIGRPPAVQTGGASFGTAVTLDAAGESFAWIFQAPKSGAIRSCSFHTGTVTTGGATDIETRLETVSATDGLPTGTLVAANTNSVFNLVDGDDNIWIKGTNFTANATVVQGTLYACVVVQTDSNFTIQGFADDDGLVSMPYTATKIGAGPTWAMSAGGGPALVFAPEYSDGSYAHIPGVWPFETLTTSTYNSTTGSIDERAAKFTPTVTMQVGGAWVWGSMTAGGGASLIFYSSTTPIANGTCVFDVDQVGATGTNTIYCRLPADITLTANSTYYLSWKPAGATNISIQEFDVDNGVGAALMDGFAGGQAFHFDSRVDDGAWAGGTTTKRPFMGILITGVTTSSTGGGHVIGGD